jgi:hypothetical protein
MSRTSPSLSTAAVDGDEHFVEMPPPVRPRPSSSQLARNDLAELQSPAADRLVGHIDATLGEHMLDVVVAQSEAEIEPDRVLNDLRGKAMAIVTDFSHRSRLPPEMHDGQKVTVTIPRPWSFGLQISD